MSPTDRLRLVVAAMALRRASYGIMRHLLARSWGYRLDAEIDLLGAEIASLECELVRSAIGKA